MQVTDFVTSGDERAQQYVYRRVYETASSFPVQFGKSSPASKNAEQQLTQVTQEALTAA